MLCFYEAHFFRIDGKPMTDALVVNHLSTAMMAPAVGTSPDVIGKAVREQTVATLTDLTRSSEQDLEAALQIVPLIAVGAARGAADLGAPFGAVVNAVMKGAIGGTSEIGGDPAQAARDAAAALIREADRQDADFNRTVVGVVTGAAETEGHRETALTEAAIRGLLDGAVHIGAKTGEAIRQALQDTAYLPRKSIPRVLGSRPMGTR